MSNAISGYRRLNNIITINTKTMRWIQVLLCLLVTTTTTTTTTTTVSAAIFYSSHSISYSPSTYPYGSTWKRSRRSSLSRLRSSSYYQQQGQGHQNHAVTALVSKNKKKLTTNKDKKKKGNTEPGQQEAQQVPDEFGGGDVSFNDLGPIGKAIAGTTQIAVATILEYVSGFFAGLVLGTVVGLPGFFFRPLEPGTKVIPKLLVKEMKGRFLRMNTRSLLWGRSWGGISAAFGGFKVAVTVVRGGKQDDWNQILSSAAAGAFFARAEGPQAMLRGALLYGGLIYIMTGGLTSNRPLHQYTEEAIEF